MFLNILYKSSAYNTCINVFNNRQRPIWNSLLLFSWDNFFSGIPEGHKVINERIPDLVGDHYIHESVFQDLTNSENGGALFWQHKNRDVRLLIENTVFIRCSSKKQGGAVCFTDEGHCIFSRVCGYQCSSSSSGGFDVVFTSDETYMKNELVLTSIAKSSQNGQEAIIDHRCSIIKVNEFNGSLCTGGKNIFNFWPSIDSSQNSVVVSYSSFSNNEATLCTVLYFRYASCGALFTKSNLIYNKQDTETNGLLMSYNMNVECNEDCILKNQSPLLIIYSNSGSFSLNNCAIDFGSDKTQGTVNFNSAEATSFVNGAFGFKTTLCYANYDKVDDITVVITPRRTIVPVCYPVRRNGCLNYNLMDMVNFRILLN